MSAAAVVRKFRAPDEIRESVRGAADGCAGARRLRELREADSGGGAIGSARARRKRRGGLCYTSARPAGPRAWSIRIARLHCIRGHCDHRLHGRCHADSVCPVVRMFHVNACCVPFNRGHDGSKVCFRPPDLDAVSSSTCQAEQVTLPPECRPSGWHAPGAGEGTRALEARRGHAHVVGAQPSGLTDPRVRQVQPEGGTGVGMTETSPVGLVNFASANWALGRRALCARARNRACRCRSLRCAPWPRRARRRGTELDG